MPIRRPRRTLQLSLIICRDINQRTVAIKVCGIAGVLEAGGLIDVGLGPCAIFTLLQEPQPRLDGGSKRIGLTITVEVTGHQKRVWRCRW